MMPERKNKPETPKKNDAKTPGPDVQEQGAGKKYLQPGDVDPLEALMRFDEIDPQLIYKHIHHSKT